MDLKVICQNSNQAVGSWQNEKNSQQNHSSRVMHSPLWTKYNWTITTTRRIATIIVQVPTTPPSSTTANRGFWHVALPWSIQIASCCPITTDTLWFNTDCIGETCRNIVRYPLTIPTSLVRVSCLFFFRPSLCLNADSLVAMMLATFLGPSAGGWRNSCGA